MKLNIANVKPELNPRRRLAGVLRVGVGFALALAVCPWAGPARADDKPTTNPILKAPEGAFEVYEWVVFITDPGQPQLNANAATLFPSTLPDFVGGRRNPVGGDDAKATTQPMPVGVVRFTGSSGGDKVDVQVTNKGGKFLAHWPKGTVRQSGLLWQNFVIDDKAPATQEVVPPGHWFNLLRAPAAPFILKEGRGEPFMLYDLEPSFKSDLKVTAGPTTREYQVSHNGKRALKDVVFYKADADGWHTKALAELSPANPPKPATTRATTRATTQPAPTVQPVSASPAPAAPPASDPELVVRLSSGGPTASVVAAEAAAREAEAKDVATKKAAIAAQQAAPAAATTTVAVTVAASKPGTQPATRASTTTRAGTQPIGTAVALGGTGVKDPTALLAPWKETLTAAGLPPTDQDLIVAILKAHALDPKRLTAVYRLDADQMEELMPLEVTPQPRKTVRVGLVIVRNIDPAIVTEIDGLLVQLGDDDWQRRESAFDALQALGAAAKPKLDAALKNAKDPEVVYRVERLIASIGQPPNADGEGNAMRHKRR